MPDLMFALGAARVAIRAKEPHDPRSQGYLLALDTMDGCGYKNHKVTSLKKTVGARELKTRLGGYLRAVRSGATILVTDRGEPVAELRPVPRESRSIASRLDEIAVLGILTRGSGEQLAAFEPIECAGRPLSQALLDERDDRF